MATPDMSVPADGTLQWSRGVFLPDSAQPGGKSSLCHIDSPGDKETFLSKASPLELRGWILGPSNIRPDTIPLAILAGAARKRYSANLYRQPRPDVKEPIGMVIGGQVLDADLHRVDPGTYQLLLGLEDAVCDTGITMTIH